MAAKLIKNDIQSMQTCVVNYSLPLDIFSVEKNIQYMPESLRVLLRVVFNEKDAHLKISSIGQAILQEARPRMHLAPLQIGLGIQLHH